MMLTNSECTHKYIICTRDRKKGTNGIYDFLFFFFFLPLIEWHLNWDVYCAVDVYNQFLA